MTIDFKLPDVGEGMEEAEIIRWLVAEGDAVAADQIVLEIQTDKALVEIPSPARGTVIHLAVEPGEIVKVGTLLFRLESGGEPVEGRGDVGAGAGAAEARRVDDSAAGRVGLQSGGGDASRIRSGDRSQRRVRAAPSVRRLATELGVDLRSVHGSGPGGRVLADDVREFVGVGEGPSIDSLDAAGASRDRTSGSSPAGSFGVRPLRGLRRATARSMAQSWSTIPHIHSFDEIDATRLLEARQAAREAAGEGPDLIKPVTFFVAAAARALRRFPEVNASIDLEAETITIHEAIHIGIAVATPQGLIVPVVRDADRLGLQSLAVEIDRLGRAAHDRSVTSRELSGGTFTVSNYGTLGGRFAAPIIRPPEAGILGFGAVRERPWAENGQVSARPTLPVCFAADHRLIDGDLSQAFQEFVKALLSNPIRLLLGD